MKYKYSSSFQQLIKSSEKLQDLLVNCSFSGSFEAWEQRKAFIAEAIHKDGSFLDLGSGNGFLIRCLQEWSGCSLVPYGVDINSDYIQKAKQLFPEYEQNFVVFDSRDIDMLSDYLPVQYDFIFHSSNWSTFPPKRRHVELLDTMIEYVKPGGRLIVGSYSEEKTDNLNAIEGLKELGARFDEVFENPESTNILAWIDK